MIFDDNNDQEVKDLTIRIISGIEVQNNLNTMLDLFLNMNKRIEKKPYHNYKKENNNSVNNENVTINNKDISKKRNFKETKRSNKYKQYKKLYEENKKKLAEIIWKSKDEEIAEETPDIEKVEEEYRKIFDTPAIEYNIEFAPVDYGEDCSYSPITVEILEKVIEELKPAAPGLDKVTFSRVCAMDVHLLSIFYILILTCGVFPDLLRKCRTKLIPKGGNLKEIKNWRPITISSLTLRIINKI